jgi:putative intracellular protease/amidase
MQIAIPMYDRFTALDAIGPYEVLSRLPEAQVTWLAHEPGLVKTDNQMLALEATARFEDVPDPDIVVVPGGWGTRDLLDDERVLAWLRGAHESSKWTTSVCTGSLLLGAAGILDGLRATSHWLELESLAGYGATPVEDRVVADGKVVTAAGVSSGLDMALWLTGQIAGEEFAKTIQLMIEYDPQPPFDSGSTSKAAPELVDRIRTAAAGRTGVTSLSG